MKEILLLLLSFFLSFNTFAQPSKTVSQEKMNELYQEIKTPYKYGLVLTPADNSLKMDCPTVFRKGKKWYMTYLTFGGRGYETWLAQSNDLLNWKMLGRIMSFTDSTEWDGNQKAGYLALQDINWEGSYKLRKYNGDYWMSYFGGKSAGYEAGNLSIGIAHTSQNPSKVHEWKRLKSPVLASDDKNVGWWENRKLFKSTVIEDKERLTGHQFVMYYNANGDSAVNNKKTRWFERIGMAVSDNMTTWQRPTSEPIVHHPVGITGDPIIQKIGDIYVMFYFGAFWKDRKGAFNRFAASYNLTDWTDWNGDNLVESSENYDNLYAHKSYVVKHKGVVYHFYCAVNKGDQRGIAVATSKDLGKSNKDFVK
ncbi:hypothetical protein LV89_01454 [Arcicella aurantiaca]|uniref:Glycosylase n=1 Tax=Arcicella aurantiaca TaxID=591202 RepID=A0A316ED34_9BACT|nr:glycosylase [Arcicella aurantiaca]PWK27563.1 hypothetical protein LV89_01454 [Arcicella aurantiaca]